MKPERRTRCAAGAGEIVVRGRSCARAGKTVRPSQPCGSRPRCVTRPFFSSSCALEEPAHGARVEHVLGREHARGQRRLVVAGQHRHHGLGHDRAVIQLGADEMHRGASHLAAFLDRPAMRVQAGERGQQRRVDVEHAALVARHEFRRQDAHEAGQHDQVGRVAVDGLGQRRVERGAVGEGLVVEHRGGDAAAPGRIAGRAASARLLMTATTRPGQSCASDARTIASRFEP